MLFAFILLAAVTNGRLPPSPDKDELWKIIEIHGQKYRFPQSREQTWQLWKNAAHVEMPGWFWQSILRKVGRPEGWQGQSSWGVAYITEPSDIFQWKVSPKRFQPPVAEDVNLIETRGTMRLWRSKGRYGQQNLVLVTYESQPDVYVECDEREIDNWAMSCDLKWHDRNLIHILSLAGDWLDKAPAVAEHYAAAVKVP